MPDITLTVSTDVANRLADAIVFERPDLIGATGAEKAEGVRQMIIQQLKEWCLRTERIQAENQVYGTLNNNPPDVV